MLNAKINCSGELPFVATVNLARSHKISQIGKLFRDPTLRDHGNWRASQKDFTGST
jgi:hypothetical protein